MLARRALLTAQSAVASVSCLNSTLAHCASSSGYFTCDSTLLQRLRLPNLSAWCWIGQAWGLAGGWSSLVKKAGKPSRPKSLKDRRTPVTRVWLSAAAHSTTRLPYKNNRNASPLAYAWLETMCFAAQHLACCTKLLNVRYDTRIPHASADCLYVSSMSTSNILCISMCYYCSSLHASRAGSTPPLRSRNE